MASDLGVNYSKTSGKARHKWTYRMLRLRNAKVSTYRASFQNAVVADTVLASEWTAVWDLIAGYLSSRGMEFSDLIGSNIDPRSAYGTMVAGGRIPYNLWSGQPLEGMTSVQAKAFALACRKFRCRFELLFDQWHNIVDLSDVIEPGLGDGGEGGQMDNPVVT